MHVFVDDFCGGLGFAAYFTIKKIIESNDLGDIVGSFWDYRGKLNVVADVPDLSKEHPYVNADRIFREHLAERKADLQAKKVGGQAAR